MTRLWLWTVTTSTVFSVLCHFVILYMVSIEIVAFCRITSLWNFQYRNHVHSITLMSFQIISQNLVQYKAWLDDVQRLRTVTSLDVSPVAGHHAMPAALLFNVAREQEVLGHRRSNLWAVELGIFCSDVYGKISAAPFVILSSIIQSPLPYRRSIPDK